METKILTPEELQTVKNLNDENSSLITQFGMLEMEIQNLELQKLNLVEKLKQLNQASTKIGNELEQKYGEGNVNLDTGEFIPR